MGYIRARHISDHRSISAVYLGMEVATAMVVTVVMVVMAGVTAAAMAAATAVVNQPEGATRQGFRGI
jgi:hypothetical protein